MKKILAGFTSVLLFATPLISFADSTVTASGNTGSTVAPSGTVVVPTGIVQTFSIGAEGGFHLTDVSFDGSSLGTPSSFDFTGLLLDPTTHSLIVTSAPNPGSGPTWCSSEIAPGWNVSLPHGGCPEQPKPVYAPSFTIMNADGSYTLMAGARIQ